MSLGSRFLAQIYDLPRARYRARRTRGIRVAMPDGVTLTTEHYAPRKPGKYPTLLMRLPYGLTGFATVAEAYAERGYNVVLQACRGTGGSEGAFDPLTHEREDGLATLQWIKARPWYDGRLGTTGPSYLGYTQWAISDALPPVSAMATKVTSAEFRSVVFPGGAFHLGLWLNWLQTVEGLERNPLDIVRRMVSGGIERRTERAARQLPLIDADIRVTGRKIDFWRRWFEHSVNNDGFWQALDHTHRLGPDTPPNHFLSGWYDFMIDQLLRDYRRLVESGQTPYLTVGNWHHVSAALQAESMRQTLIWMDAQLCGDRSRLRTKPVRLQIGGTRAWREFDAYPPPTDDLIWHLHPGKLLAQRPVKALLPDVYRYDPADPTPNLGGAIFAFTGAGPVNQSKLEARADVLTYTSEPLLDPVTIIGNVGVTLYARSSLPNTDFFVRLCDVGETGVSINICDGLIRKTSGDPAVSDNIWKLDFRLHATAHCFRVGHRLRLQVSSGAHPRYARNLGTDEPLGTATTMVAADVEVFHDPVCPSAITLPVVE